VLSWVEKGYRIPFLKKPRLSAKPRPFRLPVNKVKRGLLQAEILDLIAKNALVRVPTRDLYKPAFYSLLFLVPKSSGGFRPVIDISRLNKSIDCPHFQMETVRSIRQSIQPKDWIFSIDLSDAYLHVPLHPACHRYLRIALSPTKVYSFTVLPFGLNTAPLVFTRIATALAAHLRQQGVRVHVYLDDWLFLAQDKHRLLKSIPWILEFLESLGLLINKSKSRLEVSQSFEYLGLHFETCSASVRPADHLITKLIAAAAPQSLPEFITPRLLMKHIGLINFMADFVPLGRLFLRPIQHWLASQWCQRTGDLDVSLQTNQPLSQALAKWTDRTWLQSEVPLVPPRPTLTLCTDASLVGWGGGAWDLFV
jgi:hypothetical protein